MLLVILLILVTIAGKRYPKVVSWPPVTITCTSFNMDIKSFDESDENNVRSLTANVNVDLYDSSINLIKQKSCKLLGINGCMVFDYNIPVPGTFLIKIVDIEDNSVLWTSPGFQVTQGSALSYFSFSFSKTSPSAWQDFVVTVGLTDGCGVSYVSAVEITLSATNGISGSLVKTTSIGSVSFDVYCQNSGTNVIIASGLLVSGNTTITILQDKISFISLDPIPKLTTDVFKANVKVVANDDSELSNGEFTINFALTPSSTLQGTTSGNTAGRLLTINNFKVSTSGTYSIVASSLDLISSTSQSFTISPPALTSLDLSTSNASPSALISFTLTASLKDQSNNYWATSSTVVLTSNPNYIAGVLSVTTTSGLASFSVYCTISGTITVTATSGSKSGSITVSCLKNQIKVLNVTPTPIYTTSTFSLTAGVYSNDGNTLISSYGPFSITLSLLPSGTMSGTVISNTSGGTVTFSDLKITSAGAYNIQAENTNMLTGTSANYNIAALVLTTISITSSNSSPSANVQFILTCTLKDQAGSSWTSSTILTLTASASFVGSNTVTTATGSGEFTLYCVNSGSIIFTVSSSVTQTISLNILQDRLKIIQVTPAPSLVTQEFSVSVGVYDNTGTTSISISGPFTITLSLDPAGTLSGTINADTSSGVSIFSGIKITTGGTYFIKASAPDMISATSTLSYTITELILTSLALSVSPSTPSAYFDFSLTVTLKDQNSNLWVQSSSISLSLPSNFIGSTSSSTSSGTKIFSLYSNAPGTFTIVGTSGSVSGSLDVTILSNMIKITGLVTKPSLISDVFQAQVAVYDFSGSNLVSNYGVFTIELSLSPSGGLAGTLSKNTVNGILTFTGLSVSTPGTFVLTASAINSIMGSSESFTIQAWTLTTILLTSDNYSPSAYFDFTLTAILKDQGGNSWTTLSSVAITATNGISGSLASDISTGSGTFSVYCSISGSNKITATSGSVTAQITIDVLQNKLKISNISPIPNYVVSEFGLLVKIYDNSGITLLTSYGPFTINLSLNQTGTILGSNSISSSNGVATFTALKVTSTGTFNLIASSSDKIADSYSSITIVELALTSIQLSVSPTSPSANFDFVVTALLLDQTAAAWTASSSLSLTGSFVGGSSNTATSTGSADFTIYKSSPGTFVVTCTSGTVSATLSITVLSNKLKISSASQYHLTTTSVFSVVASVYKNDESTIEATRGSYTVNLSLDPTGVLNCGVPSVSAGVFTFPDCSFASSGEFIIQAVGTDLITGSSDLYIIGDPGIDSITISVAPSSQSTYFDIQVTVKIYDQASNLYTSGQASVSLSGSIELYGDVSGLCDHVSTITLKVYCKSSGENTITATVSGKTASVSVTILESVLRIISINPTPLYPVDTFECIIKGYDSTNTILSDIHDYTITVSLSPSGTITGTLTENSSLGTGTFSNLIITSTGNSNLKFSATGFADILSTTISISPLSLNSITLVISEISISAYKIFSATVTLLDQRNRLWTTSTEINISADKTLGGTLSETVITGTKVFMIYGKASGDMIVQASASGFSATDTIEITQVHLTVNLTPPSVSFKQLWVTSSTFTASVSIYVNDESELVGTGDNFSVTIELDPVGGLTGTLVKTSVSSVSSYSGLKITTNGSYKIKATCSDCFTGFSTSFTVNSLVLNTITLTSSITTISAYFYLTLTATLKDQVGDLWTASTVVNLADSSKFFGVNSITTSSGIATFSIYFYASGTENLVASSGSIQGILEITVLQNALKINSISQIPTLTNSVFALEVTVYDNGKNSILTENVGFTINLQLTNSGVFSGTVSKTSVNGVASFSGLSITTSGTFQIIASSNDKVSDTSISLNIAALVLTTILAVPNVSFISANFPYTISITLLDQSGGLVYTTTSLSLTSNLDINGDTSISTAAGTITAAVYSKIPGSNTITIASGLISATCSITIKENLLKIGAFSSTPKYPTSVFSFDVTVYDFLGSSIELTHGPYSITLTLQTGALSGTLVKSTTSGIASFSSLQVVSPGMYTILASCTYCISATSASFTIEAFVLSQIVVTTSNSAPSAYQDFQLTINLYDQSGISWTTLTSLTLSSPSSIQGLLSGSTNTGQATLTVYGTATGAISIVISSGSITGSCSVNIQQNLLVITSISPIPKFTTSTFNAVVCVYQQDTITLVSTNGAFLIALDTTDNSLDTSQQATTSSGCANFYSLKIVSTGTKYLFASSSGILSGTSSQLVIKSLILTLTLTPSPVSTNFDIDVLVTIKDQSNTLYTTLADIVLEAPESNLVSVTSQTITGLKSFSLHYSISGTYSISAKAELYSVTSSINVLKNTIQVSQLIQTPKYQTDTFSVVVDVFDNSKIYKETIYGSYPITIFLSPSGTLQGTLTGTTSSGQVTLSGLSISSYGQMKICGSSSDLIQGCSSLFTLTKVKPTKVVMELSEINPTAYFDFFITGNIYEQFGGYYKGLTDSVITSNMNIQGELIKSTSSGIAVHSVYCTVAGINELTLTSDQKYDKVNVNILSQKLFFNDLVGVIEAYDQLTFKVKIFDNSGSVIQSKYGTFSVTLQSVPSGLSGNLIRSTVAGVASFSGLYFSQPGDYIIKASCPEAIVASQAITVTFGEDIKITIKVPEQGASAKYLTDFPISLFNKTSGLPVSFVKFSVYVNGVLYDQLKTNAEGEANFTAFFNSSENIIIKIVYSSAEIETSIFVDESNNTDSLCLVAETQNDCSVCRDLAKVKDGICECTENSYYEIGNGNCTCIDGFFSYGQNCVTCRNYFKPSEITSYYSESYKSIIVNFERPVNIDVLASCADIIRGPEYFLSHYKNCKWLTQQILEITLVSYPDFNYKIIEINEEKVQAANTNCTLNKKLLNIEIQKKYDIPIPSVSINGPDSYSLVCGKNSLILISSSKGDSYAWSATYSSANTQVAELISSSTNNHVIIPSNYLTIGILTVQLNFTISDLGWIIALKTIKITNDLILSVQLSTGSNYYTTASKSLKITAIVKEQCANNKDFTYLWSSTSTNEAVQLAVSASSTSKNLEIESYTLIPGEKYSFNVEVAQGTATGTATTLIIVKESKLALSASKTSGEYTLEEDFVVVGTATDPDNPSAAIIYTWTCSQDSETCKNNEGRPLLIIQDSGQLIIQKSELASSTYNLYLSALSGSKLAYLTIIVSFSINASGTISLSTESNKLNPDYIYNLIPEVKVGGYPLFLWKVLKGSVKSELDKKNSYLGIPENSLMQGENYKLTMSTVIDGKESVRISMDLLVNNGPECESLNLEFSDPMWTIFANACVDLDDSDYPLVYQYGVVLENSEKWSTEPVLENIVQIYLASEAVRVKLRVCDSLETCNIMYAAIPDKMRRTADSLMDIIQYTTESSNIPNAFLSFLSKNIEYSSLNYLTKVLVQYFDEYISKNNEPDSVTINRYYIELLFDCVKTIMELGALPDPEMLSNMTNVIFKVLGKYSKRIIPDKIVELLKTSESYFESIDTKIIESTLEELASHLVIDTIPGVIYSYSGKHTLLQTRKLSLALIGYTITLDNLKIIFPKSLVVNSNDVYDFYFACLIIGSKILIKTRLFNVGSFESYNLEFLDKAQVDLKFQQPIKIIIKNSISLSSATCSDNYCRVDKVNSTHIELELFKLIDTEIYEAGLGCKLPRIPIQFAALLIFFIIILALIFYDRDKIDLFIDNDHYTFKTFLNLTSLFIKQKNPRRVNSAFQILSACLVILAIIGLADGNFDQKMSAFDVVIGVITLKNFGSGLLALCFCQLLTLTNTIFKLFRYTRQKFEYYLIILNFTIALICFILICVTSSWKCQDSVVPWMVNFGIFALVHFIILEPIYAIIVYSACKNQPMLRDRRTTKPVDITASKNSQFSIDYHHTHIVSPRPNEKSNNLSNDGNSSRIIGSFTSRSLLS